MHTPIVLVTLIGMISSLHSQESSFTRALFDSYESYKVAEITTRRLKHTDMMKVVESLRSSINGLLSVEQIGTSAEGRSINLLRIGTGGKKILFWSQMHGDEPTATMGLLDALSFIRRNSGSPEVKSILSKTTLLIIPMLNPDGAERFQRRSIQGIDINRDALRLQTPEARILKAVRDKYEPEFGFNLHDQEPRYTVGMRGDVATIALLAPAYDSEKSENAVRLRAKKIAANLALIFSQFIEGHISRYDDTFEPRAFGDNIQKWGTSTVLVESGGWKGDPEKMFIRKLNCVALLGISYSVAEGTFEQTDVAVYEKLPGNAPNLYDFIVRDVTLTFPNMNSVIADVGVNLEDSVGAGGEILRIGKVVDIGDLSTYRSFENIDGKGKTLDGLSMKLESTVDVAKLKALLK